MTTSTFLTARPQNLILSCLFDDGYQNLIPHLKEVSLQVGDVIYSDSSAKYVYFLNSGVVSVCLSNSDGDNIELCLIGNEGIIGVRSICLHNQFNLRCEMLSKGSGFKLPVNIFQKEFFENQLLARLALLQLETRTIETACTSLCNQSHPVEKRYSRWLLTVADRLGSDRLTVTQETISAALGVCRPTVSLASKTLQDAGIINCRRGIITILEREKLQNEACGCYFSTKEIIGNYREQAQKSLNK